MVLLKHWNRQFHFNTFYSIENQAHEVEGKMAQHIKCVSICFGINSLMKRSIKNSGVFFPRTHLHIIDKWQALIFRFHWHNLQIFPNFWARKWFRNYMDWFIARMLVGSMYHYSVTFWQLTTKRWKKQCGRAFCIVWLWILIPRVVHFAFSPSPPFFFPGRSSFYLFSAKFSGFLIDTVFHLATQQHIPTTIFMRFIILETWQLMSIEWNFVVVCACVWGKKIQFKHFIMMNVNENLRWKCAL